MIAPGGEQVDILPFGEIAIDDTIQLQGEGLTSIRVNGFQEVYDAGIQSIQLDSGQSFQVATLPSIVLLKLIAFDDRPEQRMKGPRDISIKPTNHIDCNALMLHPKWRYSVILLPY